MRKFNQYTPDYDRPCQKYSQCCGVELNGDFLENERCPECREFCTPVEFNDAPEQFEPEIDNADVIAEKHDRDVQVLNGVFKEINSYFL